jgi:transglutaminase-like putative cysteine protease
MRLESRRALRLRMRDLAAASAFAAVALSGALPLAVSVVFGLTLVISLAGRRPFSGQPVLSVLALLAASFVLFGLAFRGNLDLVVSAVAFATLVTAQRMLSDPSPSTDQQVLLAGLLLMAGAAALSGDLWYAISLLFFGVFSCLALGLAVVEGPVERDEELPLSPVLRQVSIGVGVALVGGIAFFVLFPRLSWNVAARRTGPGLLGGTTGMTDRVRLGGTGDLKTVARVVLRARLEPSPGTQQLDRYWVGRRFDRFDGKEWTGTGIPSAPRPRVFLGEAGGLMQRIELLPAYDSRTLVGLEHAMLFGPAQAVGPNGQSAVDLIKVGAEEVRFAEDAAAYQYVVQSRDDLPLLETEEAALVPYTALPTTVDPRVGQLAKQIVGTATEPERKAQRLERWLQSNLRYSLELGGNVDDPLAEFLFTRKAGHCEHFATALAVMLRAEGVPARVVGGFFGGELFGDRYLVRAGDAHAWVEAYVLGRGWVRLDATPEAGRGGQHEGVMAQLVNGYEQLQELWRSRVVDYTILDQWNFVRNLVKPPSSARANAEADDQVVSRAMATPTRGIVVAVIAGGLVLGLWLFVTRPRRRVHPASVFLSEIERRLATAQVTYREGEDLEALPARLCKERHPLAPAVQAASRRYLEARFGGKPLRDDERTTLLSALERPSVRAS